MALTESFAKWPGSSVSGLYLAHPDAYYCGVAKIERWPAPVLNYDPASLTEAAAAEYAGGEAILSIC